MNPNLARWYSTATADDRTDGLNWYSTAQQSAVSIASYFGISPVVVLGVIAALSPMRNWDRNLEDTIKVIKAYTQSEPLPYVHFSDNLQKCERILSGEPPSDVLRSGRTGHKVYNFLRCLLDPTDEISVCIDRWAFRALYDKDPNRTPTRRQYFDATQAYADGAREVGLIPSQFQAIIWTAIRNHTTEPTADDIPF